MIYAFVALHDAIKLAPLLLIPFGGLLIELRIIKLLKENRR